MKYKVGDKVIIKTWKEMEKEYGLNLKNINCDKFYAPDMEKRLNKLNTNRIVTIEKIVRNDFYFIKEMEYAWTEDMIKYLAESYKEPVPIRTRWEILDI